ncbi:MAG TPA: histidine phosphotransferase [Parvularcula sp.]|nr:histidine phosphotransferase [Parvularcula sp.]HBS31730.1 histidine phosphotransferase [Parvularcula sp.]HBS36346.1 histidine phosphotransferase [Parvularcula sp.]
MSAHLSAGLDAVSLSALMSSRLCHDLINPVGALSSGLEVLADPSMDETMKDAAIDLIKTSAEKSVALLKYARLAYGASGGAGESLPFEEARSVLQGMFAWSKASLDWRIAPGYAPKDEVKALLVLALSAADCAPRGGNVVVEGERGAYSIRVSGGRIIVQDDMIRALAGDSAELKPKFAPHYLTGLAARAAGGGAEMTVEEGSASITARFAPAEARALTAG